MKHEMLSKILRHYRKQQDISVKDVVLRLKEANICISPKTIYSWENGTTQPDISTLLVLCNIYQISNLQDLLTNQCDLSENLFPALLTAEEFSVLSKYRNQPNMREVVRKLLD